MVKNQSIESQLLQLSKQGPLLEIDPTKWRTNLRYADHDPDAGIAHACFGQSHVAGHKLHVARIEVRVNNHFHRVGPEHYAVVEGSGIMFFGKVVESFGKAPTVEKPYSMYVEKGDTFTIPEGYAHQLCSLGGQPITLIFSCPDSHLDNNQDRIMLPDSPLLLEKKGGEQSPAGTIVNLSDEGLEAPQHFERTRWQPGNKALNIFFDNFVPYQYQEGFAWRCRVIGQGEQSRAKPFTEHTPAMQATIAANAEVLLELYQETPAFELDIMRTIGQGIRAQQPLAPESGFEGTFGAFCEGISRRHHDKWLAQFQKDIESGKRNDSHHRGAKPFDHLESIEVTILKVQTWANCRILAGLSETDYQLLRSFTQQAHPKREVPAEIEAGP
jgi:mannose-6-phosphate isomerase-like protein (cupin superfamily)